MLCVEYKLIVRYIDMDFESIRFQLQSIK